MKRHIIAILALLIAAIGVNAAQTAEDAASLLDKAASRLASAPSVKASYQLTFKGHDGTVSGNILMAADRFTASGGDITTWYDGKTQWTYNPDAREVTVIEPTPDELAQSNPLVILSTLRKGYKASICKSAPGTRTIRLTPMTKGGDYRQLTVTLAASTLLPSAIKATLADGNEMNIVIRSISIGKKVPDSTFRFDKSKYSHARINDMR